MTKDDIPDIKDGRITNSFKVTKNKTIFSCVGESADGRGVSWEINVDHKNKLIFLERGGNKRIVRENGEVLKKGYTDFNDVKHLCDKNQFHILYTCGFFNYFSNNKNLFLDFDKDDWAYSRVEEVPRIKNGICFAVNCYIDTRSHTLFRNGERKFVIVNGSNIILYEVRKNNIGILSKPLNFIKFDENKHIYDVDNYIGDSWFFNPYYNEDIYHRISNRLKYGGCEPLSKDAFEQIVKIVNENGDLILEDQEDSNMAREIMIRSWLAGDEAEIEKLERERVGVADELDLICYNKLIEKVARRMEVTKRLKFL